MHAQIQLSALNVNWAKYTIMYLSYHILWIILIIAKSLISSYHTLLPATANASASALSVGWSLLSKDTISGGIFTIWQNGQRMHERCRKPMNTNSAAKGSNFRAWKIQWDAYFNWSSLSAQPAKKQVHALTSLAKPYRRVNWHTA